MVIPQTGFYTGYVAGAFTLGRLLSGYLWGYVSDSVGRRPVILVGLSATAVLSLTFGLSTTYELAISSRWVVATVGPGRSCGRFVLGIMNGITPAVRTTVYEVCGTNSHVVQAMAYIDGEAYPEKPKRVGASMGPQLVADVERSDCGKTAEILFLNVVHPPPAAFTSGSRAGTIVFGSAMGGLLAQPVDHYPSVFSATGLFGRFFSWTPHSHIPSRFPFLLPNLVGMGAALLLLPTVIAYVPETKDFEKNRSRSRFRRSLEHGDVSAQQGAQEPRGMNDSGGRAKHKEGGLDACEPPVTSNREQQGHCGPGGLLSVPRVKPLLFLVCVVQSLLAGFEEVFPLWALSTVGVGGLDWGTMEIGKVLFVSGCIMVVAQVFIFPSVIKILGAVTWMRTGCLLGICTFLATPNAKLFSWNYTTLFVASVASVTIVNCSLAAVGIALAVASTDIVSSRLRGKLSGLYGTAESFGRFASAVGSAVLFAWSISSDNLGWVDHRFVFYSSALALGVATVVAWRTLPAEISGDKPAAENVEDVIHDAGLTPKSDPKVFVSCSRPTGKMDLI
ncbi:unnamed protein product [Ectocarpus sp. CCAP 1310/34]|nr:unnamed protein product [Ectocarpus sp. CCAP 1310/34]